MKNKEEREYEKENSRTGSTYLRRRLISVTQTDTVLADGGFSYEDVANREFLFCSGAGAWSTVLDNP